LEAQTLINLGALAAGSLKIESGGKVTTPNCTITKGTIEVGGTSENPSQLAIDSSLAVGGDNGSGSIVIENGGLITAKTIRVGNTANSSFGRAAPVQSKAGYRLPGAIRIRY
jgi:hypothetical protein